MARDMTEKQFKEALKRNGFKSTLGMWFTHVDHPKISFGAVLDPKTMKTRRRATLAHILKRKAEEDAKRDRERKAQLEAA